MPDCAAPSLRIADLLCHATKRLRAAGVESPARDARLLLAHSLGVAHPALLDRQHSVSEAQAQTLWRMRESIPLAARDEGVLHRHDIAVAVSRIPGFIEAAGAALAAGMAGLPGGRGGTGRRAGFRFQCRKTWGFEPLRPHQDLC